MGRRNYNYYVYLMTNRYHTVLYAGMTNDILRRTLEHKSKRIPGFTSRYRVTKLVYFEHYNYVWDAIQREKQLKSWSRRRKEKLIETLNPEWNDLYDEIAER